MNNTLKQLQEKEIDFLSFQIYEEEPTNYYTNVKMLKSYINQQTTLAYNAGKADMLDTVLKEIDSLNTVDIKDESGDVVREQLISKDKLKNKLLASK